MVEQHLQAEGVTYLDTTKADIEEELPDEQEFEAETDIQHFALDEPILVQIGESVGNPIFVEADHFLAISVDTVRELGPMEILQRQQEGEEIEMPDEEGAAPTEHLDEATVVVSNEDGVPGGAILTEDGAGLSEALDKFVEDNL